MRAHWWLLLIFVVGAAGLRLATGDWWSVLWAVPMAPVLTEVAVFTARRSRRHVELADRPPVRPGTVKTLRSAAVELGCGLVPRSQYHLTSEAHQVWIAAHVCGPDESQGRFPEKYVLTEVSIDEWTGMR
ncbi:hypothetical protein ACWED2_22545 [Amycolatopsis sp. NPDC005003]